MILQFGVSLSSVPPISLLVIFPRHFHSTFPINLNAISKVLPFFQCKKRWIIGLFLASNCHLHRLTCGLPWGSCWALRIDGYRRSIGLAARGFEICLLNGLNPHPNFNRARLRLSMALEFSYHCPQSRQLALWRSECCSLLRLSRKVKAAFKTICPYSLYQISWPNLYQHSWKSLSDPYSISRHPSNS